jgi:hypothetical protein
MYSFPAAFHSRALIQGTPFPFWSGIVPLCRANMRLFCVSAFLTRQTDTFHIKKQRRDDDSHPSHYKQFTSFNAQNLGVAISSIGTITSVKIKILLKSKL